MTKAFFEHQEHVLDMRYLGKPLRADCLFCQMAIKMASDAKRASAP